MEAEREADRSSGRAYGATWRDRDGQVVSTTWAGTMCRFPVMPWRLRIEREGYTHIVRCGECRECREFERRRLAGRLCERYPDKEAKLWVVRIWVDQRHHQRFARSIHRRPGLELEPGFWRMGPSSLAVIAREKRPLRTLLMRLGLRSTIARVRLGRGRRAWRDLTAGLLVSREVYGEEVKRWYSRGLPAAERKDWTVVKAKFGKGYDSASSPRAWKGDNLILVPPDAWAMYRIRKRDVLRDLALARTPEMAAGIAELSQTLGAALSIDRPREARPKRVTPERDRTVRVLREMAAKGSEDARSATENLTPNPLGRGLQSSIHSESSETPPAAVPDPMLEIGASGRPRWQERELERAQKIAEVKKSLAERGKEWIEDWGERMGKLVRERGPKTPGGDSS